MNLSKPIPHLEYIPLSRLSCILQFSMTEKVTVSKCMPLIHLKISQSLIQLLSFLVGVGIMFLLLLMPGHGHAHADELDHDHDQEIHLELEHN